MIDVCLTVDVKRFKIEVMSLTRIVVWERVQEAYGWLNYKKIHEFTCVEELCAWAYNLDWNETL